MFDPRWTDVRGYEFLKPVTHRVYVLSRLTRPCLAPIAVLAVALVSGWGQPAPASAQSFVPAQSARAFGDSVGVNVRLTHIDTSYGDYDTITARLRELGVRYVNDTVCPTCEYQIAQLQRLAALGIRANLAVGWMAGGTASIAPGVQALRDRLRSSVVSVNTINEPDISGDPAWIDKTRAFQAELYRQVKSDPLLAHLPVIGPSLVNRGSRALLGDLTPYLDRGNLHPYSGGLPPLLNLEDERQVMSAVSGSKPLVITEVGYHTDMAHTSPHRPASEAAVAVYTPRIALEAFRFGVERTYLYTLADQWSDAQAAQFGISKSENSFGLLRWNLTPKPSFLALRNLLRTVDGGSAPVASPGGMRVGLEGAGPDVQQLLLRSADGSYALVLWRNVSVWDRDAQRDIVPPPDALDVVLGEPVALARRFNPVVSDAERQRWTDPQRIPVELSGGPVVLRLTPPGAAGTKGLRTGTHGASKKRKCAAGAVGKSARKTRRKARAHCCPKARTHKKGSRKKAKRKRPAASASRRRAGASRKATWKRSSSCVSARRR
ncbi:MAG: hypothetical protein QOH58_1644 [Thermoleophilaceae bacterium]|nr:hypothetical protein [Thermoleophilaceae bacterium]